MAIEIGEKIHIVTRRIFENDLRRHFAGTVEKISGSILRIRGYVFVFDGGADEFVRRDEERVRIFSASDTGLIINILPMDTDISALRYGIDDQGRRVVTDGKTVSLDVSEFGARR